MTFVAFEGVIGVGKTTLARYLQEALKSTLVLEVFEENPFLSSFYQDRERYAFQTQMFFLLSRYQQLRELDKLPRPIVSDYMFAKDQLFARQTLRGDELMMYERVYAALAESTPRPDLVVYLRADTPTLMSRIIARDRPYERNMDEGYIDSLRVAYEQFFATFPPAHLLSIDTNNLNVVDDEQARRDVIQRILSRLGAGPRQFALPGLDELPLASPVAAELPTARPSPKTAPPFSSDLLLNVLLLQQKVGDLSKVVRELWSVEGSPNDQLQARLAGIHASLRQIAESAGLG